MVRTARTGPKWTALTLGPLPGESTLSLVTRFAHLNGVSKQALRTALGYQPKSSIDTSARTCHLDARKVQSETGWPIPLPEAEAIERRPGLFNHLFTSSFRFCEVCLRSGYHSFWHQLDMLAECPVHGIALTTHCRNCGGDLEDGGRLVGSSSGFYVCKQCGAPVAEYQFSWRMHAELRDTIHRLKPFSALDEWWASAPGLDAAEQVLVQNQTSAWHQWGDVTAVVQHVVRRRAPLPSQLRSPRPRSALSMLEWNLALSPRLRSRNDGVNRNDHYESSSNALYLSTLLKLHHWIFPRGAGSKNAAAMLALRENGRIEGIDLDPKHLALAWFRLIYENRTATPFEWLDPTRAKWAGAHRIRHVGLQVQRLPARAVFLGVYAILLELTTRQLDVEGVLRLNGIDTIPSLVPLVYLPFCSNSAFSHARSEGFVVFPTVAGLDISAFWPGAIL